MKLTGQRGQEEPEINLVSLIDVVFCVIIFLVVTTTFDVRTAMKLELPQARANASIDPDQPVEVLIDADGRYFINNNEVLKRDVDSLKEAIDRIGGEDRTRRVVIRADARTPHQAVVGAMDALGQLGYSRVAIATTPERKQ